MIPRIRVILLIRGQRFSRARIAKRRQARVHDVVFMKLRRVYDPLSPSCGSNSCAGKGAQKKQFRFRAL
jgi:hypothetical protein